MHPPIEEFLKSEAFGVVGASTDRVKYGNRVLRAYQSKQLKVIPVHPRETTIEGEACVPSVAALPASVSSISVITPPKVTEQVVEAAIAKGIKNIWMQPGAESAAAVASCKAHGINVIADGSCALVILGFRER